MESAEDSEFLNAMRKANIKGALVGIEAVTKEGLKAVFKDFNLSGETLVQRLREFQDHGVHVLGSFIFGHCHGPPRHVPSHRGTCFAVRADVRSIRHADPFCGTVDFERWEKSLGKDPPRVDGIPITRYWLIPAEKRPKMFMPHPTMTPSNYARERSRCGTTSIECLKCGSYSMRHESESSPCLCFHFQVIPTHVCEHGHATTALGVNVRTLGHDGSPK